MASKTTSIELKSKGPQALKRDYAAASLWSNYEIYNQIICWFFSAQ
jgi:hypothetical protein